MKRTVRLILPLLLFAFITQISFAVNTVKNDAESQFLQLNFGVDNVQDFVSLTWKEAAAAKNQKLTLREKLVLKIAQQKVKRNIKKDRPADAEAVYTTTAADFSIGGFLLGFFLGPIGILIALLFGRRAVRSSLIGCLCAIIVWAIALVV